MAFFERVRNFFTGGEPPRPPPPPAPPLERPWRHIGKKGRQMAWNEEMETSLREACLRDDLDLLRGGRQARILVLGATGSGKSSFVKSLYSALTDEVKAWTHAAASTTTVSKFLYNPPLRIGGEEPYFRIVDAPGILETDEAFYTDFVTMALQGQLREGIEIPPGRIQTNGNHFVEHPEVLDRPCLVVFVLRPGIFQEDSVLKRKFDIVMDHASRYRTKVSVVLTKADLLSQDERHPLKDEDAKYMFRSQAVQKAVRSASSSTGLPENQIFPVTNYTQQTETCTEMNIVHLYALSKLLADAKYEAECRMGAAGM